MKLKLTLVILSLCFLLFVNLTYAQYKQINRGNPGVEANVLQNDSKGTKIEYTFNGYYYDEISINGTKYLDLKAPEMVWTMEKGLPQIPIFRKSIVIPDLPAMTYRIIEQQVTEFVTKPIAPSKGHMTRDIDPSIVPYTFDKFYTTDNWYPEENIVLDEPYIVRDLRGMTIQFNPIQYNPARQMLHVVKRIVIEVYPDISKSAINPFVRTQPLVKVPAEFADIYRNLFMNYGTGFSRYDTIAEPGRMLVIYPASYSSAINPFIQWKTSRGLTVLTAEYPTATGSGAAAIKTYIQNLYNQPQKITYIVLVGDNADIPTLNGVYESAPSDPCYVKLAGTDAYPDAFISRISCQNPASIFYAAQKFIKFERDIDVGAPWFTKGTGIGGPDVGGSPPYADSIRMNWIRDTLMAHGFTQVDKINGPIATPQSLINVLNDGRYVLNYIGHGSGTSWSNTNFSVTNAYQLANGWKNPFLIDVACLNGNFTLNECLAEALLRAGDTANPKGCISIYASSTNASWVPPCDMQTHAIHLFANQFRKTMGAISFFGVMKGMDLWGGSSGEGLKLMEQYNIIGDCSVLLSRGVPLGPAITHTPLPNTENITGPYPVNCIIQPMNSPLDPSKTRLFWTRTSTFDSVLMTNSSGNNWSANIPGNSSPAIYKYYIKTCDMMNRVSTSPGGAPTNYYSFTASSDTAKPVIVHTPLQDCPKLSWPSTVAATVTDNIGVDSVWVEWYKNTPANSYRFKLLNTTGNNYSAAFNSNQSQVAYNDSIFYRVYARDNSNNHNQNSTALYKFKIIAQATVTIGTGTTSCGWPFYTYYMDSRTDMLYTANEITTGGGGIGTITKIGFDVISAASQVMNGFEIKMQHTTNSSLTGFTSTGWTTVYTGNFTVPGAGWQLINLTTPFAWNGTSNLLIEICFNNSSYTSNTTVNGTANTLNQNKHQHTDLSSGSGCTDITSPGSSYTARPNIRLVIETMVGNQLVGNQIPDRFSLEQNYPNPFNPVTKITYALPKSAMTKLKIYDVIGREVSVLVNEVKQPGVYIVDFDASFLASGVYYYKLEAGDFSDVKKMILIK